ncbi:two-component system chemotaxis response regulator CheB [Sphingobium fontiphilum]|uniref:Two-component system chemotaxis response regulator CheB n=1 Tax=Sphingobium fontiphilum TaxID=944425 RepID=A0A7W6GN12_9SPHN|nr:response regulator [Sphingobium fontiphilum]MBB3981826.1 two-component system chemotaxis response regulator CheB [Sphingobium fontiphilum]
MKPIRIVVVDDSLTIRAMIETLLERDRRVEVVGIARNGEEAIDLVKLHKPDVVTLDIAMPGKDGMAILDDIMAIDPCPVIMLSSLMRDGAPIVAEAMDRGAAACFNKAMIAREAGRFIALVKEVGRRLTAVEPVAIAA